jgi:hypothetical protein
MYTLSSVIAPKMFAAMLAPPRLNTAVAGALRSSITIISDC